MLTPHKFGNDLHRAALAATNLLIGRKVYLFLKRLYRHAIFRKAHKPPSIRFAFNDMTLCAKLLPDNGHTSSMNRWLSEPVRSLSQTPRQNTAPPPSQPSCRVVDAALAPAAGESATTLR